MLKKIWYDPVWSKVIATIIFAALAALAGLSWNPIGTFLLSASLVPHWLLGLLCLVAACIAVILLTAAKPKTPDTPVHITPVGETIIGEDKNPGRGFPLKVYRVMRNDSNHCADVQIADYRAATVTLKEFVTGVLQVKLREWYPDKEGVERVPVLPGQQFKAWVGADDRKFTKDQLERLRGQIGTLVLKVNGQRVDISL